MSMKKICLIILVACYIWAMWNQPKPINIKKANATENTETDTAQVSSAPPVYPDVWSGCGDIPPLEKEKIKALAQEYLDYVTKIAKKYGQDDERAYDYKPAEFGKLKNGYILQSCCKKRGLSVEVAGGCYRTASDFYNNSYSGKKALSSFYYDGAMHSLTIYFLDEKGESLGYVVMEVGQLRAYGLETKRILKNNII